MGNLKKFLSNKNIVTLIGAILIVVVLYLFYNWRVNSATQPVSIPYAIHSIEPLSQITQEDVATVDIPQDSVRGGVIYNASEIYGGYSTQYIPAGGFFYKFNKTTQSGNVVDDKDDLPSYYLYSLGENQIAYNFKVNTKTTYGNSFFPNQYFDIYLVIKTGEDQSHIMFGKLISNLKILAVRDGSGRDVFASTEQVRSPSQIIFGVDAEMNALLRGAEKVSNIDIILVPTPAARKYGNETPEPKLIESEIVEYLYNEAKIDRYEPNPVEKPVDEDNGGNGGIINDNNNGQNDNSNVNDNQGNSNDDVNNNQSDNGNDPGNPFDF